MTEKVTVEALICRKGEPDRWGAIYPADFADRLRDYVEKGRPVTADFDPNLPIGRAVSVREDDQAVYLTVELDDTYITDADLSFATIGPIGEGAAGAYSIADVTIRPPGQGPWPRKGVH